MCEKVCDASREGGGIEFEAVPRGWKGEHDVSGGCPITSSLFCGLVGFKMIGDCQQVQPTATCGGSYSNWSAC